MKHINLAILGFGTVGSGIYRIVDGIHDQIMECEDLDITIKHILVKSLDEPNTKLIEDQSVFTTDFDTIINDPQIDIVAECMGGVQPALTFLTKALESGRSIVTSNKEVFSKHWLDLERAAKKGKAGLNFEATAAGGIPIIRTLTHSMQGNRIEQIMGIINGTTNYILTQMSENKRDFADVLKEAQAKGYAEFDPTADVEGYDAMYKLSILSSLAFHTHVPIDKIYREGITKLTIDDIECAKELGYAIKLLAIGKQDENGKIEARVHPTMIPLDHPLSTVRGSFNAVFIHGHSVDDVMLYGRGAGTMPTASAMVSDIVIAAKEPPRYATFDQDAPVDDALFADDWMTSFFINMRVVERAGVLAAISSVFAKHQVSLDSVMQRAHSKDDEYVHLVFITSQVSERSLQAAMEEIKELDVVHDICNIIRVEGGQDGE